jgi:hypothetical protein
MNDKPIGDKHIAPLIIIIAGLLFIFGMGLFI